MRCVRWIAWLVLFFLFAGAACGRADRIPGRLAARLNSIGGATRPDLSRDEVQQALVRQLRVAPVPPDRGGNLSHRVFPTRETLMEFYDDNGHRLAWCNDSGNILPSTRTLLDALRRAGDHGLDPEDYALSRLELLEAQIGMPPLDDAAIARLADFDLLMTAAFFRYASDLSTGRVHPDEIRNDWHTNPPELDPLTKLDQALRDGTLAELLEALPPPHTGYTRLREALKNLRGVETPGGARIRQVELNLERWRWIPRQLGDPHVFVNIPAFDLALVRGGVIAWRTRIVVGKAFTPTPVFSDQIVAVVANPPWNVPRSIALGEYLPELREDKGAFARHGLRLLDGPGEDASEVDPSAVDWDKLEKGDFPYRLRQDPGPESALGRLKFHLTNDFHIYLHDTPTRNLFDRSGRDLSHGCIRVERPLELAEQLLGDASRELLRVALGQTEERHLPVRPQVPIHILYLTAWVDEAGVVRFSPDIYEFDGPQRAALDRVASRVPGGPASGASEGTRPPAR